MACSSPAIFHRSSFPGAGSSPASSRAKIRAHRVRLFVAASSEGNGGFSSSSDASASSSSSSPEGNSYLGSSSSSPRLKMADYEAMPAIGGAKRVVLVRHGQSTWNEEGRIQGSSDWAVLTPKGESQAETSKQMLMADNFDLCFHSPLARAKKTAEIIWASRRNPMVSVDDLREIDLYAFQGLMKNEGKQRYGDAYKKWQTDPPNFIIDGHYPVRELWVRAQNCWSKILTSQGSSILVVAHNAVNQALVATAAGLGPNYFRQLLQSNCGVTVIDFTPRFGGDGPPYTCLDRLNQTPSPPIAAGQSGGRKAKARLVFVCHGATESSVQNRFPAFNKETMTMLGVIQSRKTAELLLDVRASTIFCSPQACSAATAAAICEVQEAADCLGADCVPRYVELKQLPELKDMNWGSWEGKTRGEVAERERWQDFLQHEDVDGAEKLALLWERAGVAWRKLKESLSDDDEETGDGKTNVVVADEMVLVAMLGHCLQLSQSSIGSFRLDTAGLSVIDFPDGHTGRGVVRCWNYTAHLGRWAVPVTRPALADEEF